MSTVAVPPLIPTSAKFSSMEVDIAKIDALVGDALSTLNIWKGSVRVATTANITLSAPQTIDGVAAVATNLVLVKNQTDAIENGIYIVNAGTWDRASNLIVGSNAAGVAVFVNEGTISADTIWVCTSDAASAVVGTNTLVFASQASIAKTDVTQITSITTPVDVNASAGTITTVSSTLLAVTIVDIPVTNTSVLADSVVHVTIENYAGTYFTNGIPIIAVDTIAAGSFNIRLINIHAANALLGVLKIGFTVV